MNDLSPEAIAQLATRLYNDVPGANAVPKSETAVRDLPSEAPKWLPGIGPMPSNAPVAAPSEPQGSPDGLRAFVQGLRGVHHRGGTGFNPDETRRDGWHGPSSTSAPVEG